MRREDLTKRCREAELRRPEFIVSMDAIDGLGGFRPSMDELIEGSYGAVSQQALRPAPQKLDPNDRCYLDRHPREGDDKFARRRRASFFLNLVRRVHRIVIGFLFRQGPTRNLDGAHPLIKRFCDDVDGKHTPIAKFDVERARIALQFGTCPTLLNAPDTRGALNREQADRMTGGRGVYAENLYPEMLYDYRRDVDGTLLRAKVVDQYQEDTAFDRPDRSVTRARVLTRTDRTTWTMTQSSDAPLIVNADGSPAFGGGDPVAAQPVEHKLGVVPLVLAYFDKSMSGGLLGVTPMSETCQLNRELYNTQSREAEHERAQVFALLVLQGNRKIQQTLVAVGTENALIVDPGCTLVPSYLAPPGSVAQTLDARIARFRRDIMQLWGMGWYDDPTGGPESGTAKEWRFAEADANFSNFARNLAESDAEIQRLQLRYSGLSEQETENAMRSYKCQWPTSFNLEELTDEIDRATKLLELPFDPVTKLAIITRLRDLGVKLAPDLKSESDRLLKEYFAYVQEQGQQSRENLAAANAAAAEQRAQGGPPQPSQPQEQAPAAPPGQ
jgi:hypothetical protein